jgi:hypothetical protein
MFSVPVLAKASGPDPEVLQFFLLKRLHNLNVRGGKKLCGSFQPSCVKSTTWEVLSATARWQKLEVGYSDDSALRTRMGSNFANGYLTTLKQERAYNSKTLFPGASHEDPARLCLPSLNLICDSSWTSRRGRRWSPIRSTSNPHSRS